MSANLTFLTIFGGSIKKAVFPSTVNISPLIGNFFDAAWADIKPRKHMVMMKKNIPYLLQPEWYGFNMSKIDSLNT